MERDRNRVRLMDMRRLGLFVTALAGTVVLTACGNGDDDTTVVPDDGDPGSQTEDTPLTETYWELGGLSANDTTTELSGDVGAYLQITDEAVGGNTGCNAFGGDAEINEDGTVTFTDVIATMRACSGEKGDADKAMLTVLRGTVTVEIDGENLTLTNADGDALQLTATEEPAKNEPAEDEDPADEDDD